MAGRTTPATRYASGTITADWCAACAVWEPILVSVTGLHYYERKNKSLTNCKEYVLCQELIKTINELHPYTVRKV